MVDQIIRPADLPNRASPNASEKIPVDNGSNVAGATVESIVLAGRPTASQAEAEAGTDAVKAMTPLTTKQSIASEVGVTIASKAQGDLASTAVQPGDLATVATTGDYDDLINKPIIPPGLADGDKGDISVSSGGSVWKINKEFDTVADLIADVSLGYAGSGSPVSVVPGDIITAQGYRYEVAASDALDWHVETAGGVKLYVVSKILTPEMFGAVGDGVADDREAFVKCFSVGGKVIGSEGAIYGISSPLPVITKKILFDGNWCKFVLLNAIPDALLSEHLFELRAARSEMKRFEAEYPHSFAGEGLYTGVSALRIEANYCRVEDAEIYGWSRIGVRAGARGNVKSPVIKRVNAHHNKAAGVMLDFTTDAVVSYCEMNFNGLPGNGGGGYGFAGNSSGNPVNTKVLYNVANDNIRKGIDFHAGTHGTIIGNTCLRNRSHGIAIILHTTGDWYIRDNTIGEMNYVPEATFESVLTAIQVGQSTAESGDVLLTAQITGNKIYQFSDTGSVGGVDITPIIIYAGNRSYIIGDNDLRVGNVRNFINVGATGTAGLTYGFDTLITGNHLQGESLVNHPIYINEGYFRQLVATGNRFLVGAGPNLFSMVRFDVSHALPAAAAVIVKDNIAILPTILDLAGEGFVSRLASFECLENNYVNGIRQRDWINGRYVWFSGGIPAWGSWTRGSVVHRSTINAGETPGWVCTTTGSPGTWKAMANLAA